MKRDRNFYDNLQDQLRREIRHWKRQKFLFKTKIFLLFILPAIILLLTVKVLKTWLRIRLRGIALPSGCPVRKTVHQETIPNTYVTPEPVLASGTAQNPEKEP